MFAAEAAWPRSGLSSWIAGRKLSREPWSASTESAQAMSAACASRRARTTPERREGAHELGPVDEREPFLGLEAKRLEPRPGERVGAREKLPVRPERVPRRRAASAR